MGEIFHLGQDLKLKKMASTMEPEKVNARASFEALGFHVEANLQDWVADRAGESHNLLATSLSATDEALQVGTLSCIRESQFPEK